MEEKATAVLAGSVTFGGNLIVNRIGLGTNRITNTPEARAVLKRAIELGINFIDTADYYTSTESESTIGNTLAPYPTGVVIATKGGMTRDDRKVDGRPEYLRKTLEGSLKRLKLSQIPLYQLHRVDPTVPLVESVGALKQMQDEGKILHIGLSAVTVMQIEEARKVATIASVQDEYNLGERKHEQELSYCEAAGIVFIPWFPLGRGKISQSNSTIVSLAAKYGATPNQILLGWLLKRSPAMLPIPGTLSTQHLEENASAGKIKLSEEDFVALGQS